MRKFWDALKAIRSPDLHLNCTGSVLLNAHDKTRPGATFSGTVTSASVTQASESRMGRRKLWNARTGFLPARDYYCENGINMARR
jgi:hypothetical protein